MPRAARFAAPLGLQPGGEQGSEALLPVRRRLMGEGEAPREEDLRHVVQAELVLQAPRHDKYGTSVGTGQMIEGCACTTRRHAMGYTCLPSLAAILGPRLLQVYVPHGVATYVPLSARCRSVGRRGRGPCGSESVVRRAISVVVGAAQEGHGTIMLLMQSAGHGLRIPQQPHPPLLAYSNMTLPLTSAAGP